MSLTDSITEKKGMTIEELFRILTAQNNEINANIRQICKSWNPGREGASTSTVVLEEEKKDPAPQQQHQQQQQHPQMQQQQQKVISLSQPQLTQLPVMSPPLVAATTPGTIAGRPPTKLRRIEPQP